VIRRDHAGGLAIAVGFGVAVLASVLGPRGAPPLYDGVVPLDPYRYLAPSSGQLGGATAATTTMPVPLGTSPIVALGTPEQPPQAQMIAHGGALILPPGTTSITVSITPVPSSVQPQNAQVLGNVYRFSVTNQAGTAVTARSDAQVTLALRAPGTVGDATVERLVGGTWTMLQTAGAGFPGTFETTGLTEFGDFALIGQGAGGTGPDLALVGTILGVAAAGAFVALLAWTLVGWGVDRIRRR
jgi:hypothetical protein